MLSRRPSGNTDVNTYMLFAGREVRFGNNCARGLEYGPRSEAVLKTRGTVIPNTGLPWSANNVFIFIFRRVVCKQFLC